MQTNRPLLSPPKKVASFPIFSSIAGNSQKRRARTRERYLPPDLFSLSAKPEADADANCSSSLLEVELVLPCLPFSRPPFVSGRGEGGNKKRRGANCPCRDGGGGGGSGRRRREKEGEVVEGSGGREGRVAP